ncbi:hypothetical protein RIF29_00344 [Crotalaria pallida]|uniref:FAE domain-containing protein n=1 Tax=Crotalaria pallida TaxID=3830 RepID=A0AAN9P762_CROPI
MGCIASVITIYLAKDLLHVYRNTYAILVNIENITQNWYDGNKKSMLILNCLFRIGGTIVLLSNKGFDRRKSKYELAHIDLITIADGALINITTLGRLVLPISKQFLFISTLKTKKLFKSKIKPYYILNFKLAFVHFCIHGGERPMVDDLEKNLWLCQCMLRHQE